jgi:hypothetical protein
MISSLAENRWSDAMQISETREIWNALEKVEGGTQHDPLYAVLVAFSQGLPYGLFLGGPAGDADSSATATRPWGVLLDLAKFDALGGYIVAGVGKVEHAPEGGVGVRFRDLEERQIGGVRGGEGEFVDGGDDACVRDGPF